MKILAFVDVHGSQLAMAKIMEKAQYADLLVCAGDLTVFENHLDRLLSQLAGLKKQLLIVPGNHEYSESLNSLLKKYERMKNINEDSFVIDDSLFLGYGGGGFSTIDRRFDIVSRAFEKKMRENHGKKTIMVTHAPPYGTRIDKIMNEHCGSKSLKRFIMWNKPSLVISGHLHENAGKADIVGKTKLVNPGPFGEIIEV